MTTVRDVKFTVETIEAHRPRFDASVAAGQPSGELRWTVNLNTSGFGLAEDRSHTALILRLETIVADPKQDAAVSLRVVHAASILVDKALDEATPQDVVRAAFAEALTMVLPGLVVPYTIDLLRFLKELDVTPGQDSLTRLAELLRGTVEKFRTKYAAGQPRSS